MTPLRNVHDYCVKCLIKRKYDVFITRFEPAEDLIVKHFLSLSSNHLI